MVLQSVKIRTRAGAKVMATANAKSSAVYAAREMWLTGADITNCSLSSKMANAAKMALQCGVHFDKDVHNPFRHTKSQEESGSKIREQSIEALRLVKLNAYDSIIGYLSRIKFNTQTHTDVSHISVFNPSTKNSREDLVLPFLQLSKACTGIR